MTHSSRSAGRHYALRSADSGELFCDFDSLKGFFIGRWDSDSAEVRHPYGNAPDIARFQVIGLGRVSQVLTDPIRRGSRDVSLGSANLLVLNHRGEPMGRYWIGDADLADWTVSNDRILNLTFTGWIIKHPHLCAETAWNAWRAGPPTEPDQWTLLPTGQREGWLEVTGMYEPSNPAQPPAHADPVVLDGRHITDLAGFFCALGEAVHGPGGYFGSGFGSLAECLRTGTLRPGSTLHWKHARIAEQHLSRISHTVDGPMTQLDRIVRILRDAGIEPVLDKADEWKSPASEMP